MSVSLERAERAAASHPTSGRPATRETFDWPVVLIAFVVIAGFLVAKAVFSAATTPLILDTDDAMRLVTVRDLLAGQNWFDHLQYRLNTPFTAEIHWSHLVDAAIGGVILLLRPFAGGMAETIAVYVWPLLLLLALLTLEARLAFRLGGRAAMLPAVVLPALSPALITEFSPGRIDHDSIQILLLLLMAWGAIECFERPRFAWLVGGAAALSMTIGIGGLPNVIAAVVALALIWVARPERADALRNFGLSFAGATLLLFAEALPPSRWFQPACDAISIVYVAFAVGVGAVFLLLSVLPLARYRPWLRLVIGGALGALLALSLAKAFPLCLGGPYAALDPWLVHNWLDRIGEARPIWESAAGFDAFTIAVGVPPILGLVVIACRVRFGPRDGRGGWLVLGLFLAITVAVMCVEVRGARLAAPLALPAAGWLIAMARQHYLETRKLSGALALLGSWLGFAGTVIAVAVVLVTQPFAGTVAGGPQPPSANACLLPKAFAALAALPPARVMTPIDLGSHLLLFTPHSVVAAPYHRDQTGVRDAFRFFNGPIEAARQILAARGVTLVVICPQMPELRGLPDAAPDSFVRLYAADRLPTWLQPASGAGDALKVFRVLR
jgi:hypothetical protein